MPHNCVGVFCEDIREESGGTHTLVGVMPDNINVTAPSTSDSDSRSALLFPRLAIYLRVHLDASRRPDGPISARLTLPRSEDITIGVINEDVISKAYDDSASKGQPIVGLIFKAVLAPIQLRESGAAVVYTEIEGQQLVSAILNIQMAR